MDEKNETSAKYLYGASVQGIQDFIFQTNKLKEIVGASELVEQICTTAFDTYAKKGESIVRAAGNIKYIFSNREDCEEAVRNFPRDVMTMAPGITISQAVVLLKADKSDYSTQSNELEKLLRAQRNKASHSMTLGLIGIKRAPSTGLPAVEIKKENELLDEASLKKQAQTKRNDNATIILAKKAFDSEKVKITGNNIAYDIDEIAGNKSWIAVIHADGNGLGNIVQQVCKNADDAKTFSTKLDIITLSAAKAAFNSVWGDFNKDKVIPIRPIVLGGDDLTVICRADLAVDFTKIFLEKFEEQSKEELQVLNYDVVKKGLTACAGIAFVKSSYPFHYAIHLAESLCRRAKNKARCIDKDLAPSCLMFHKVQDSFVEDFNEIVKRELTPQKNLNLTFEFGPYYCGKYAETFGIKCKNTIDNLLKNIENFKDKEGNVIQSHIRQWLSLLFDNVDAANQKMKRLRSINTKANKMIEAEYEDIAKLNKIPYHDILSLATILY